MRALIVLVVSVAILGIGTSVALADQNLTPTSAFTAHRHYINGVEVGPRYCDNANLKGAFLQFHVNVHSHSRVNGAIGPVAPGLHDGSGPTIVPGAC